MKSAGIQLVCALAFLSFAFAIPEPDFTTGTDGTGDKKGKNKESIKELSGEFDLTVVDEFEINRPLKIRIYNKHDVLVYESEGSELSDISEVNLRKCFAKCEFLMRHNNISYYIINS